MNVPLPVLNGLQGIDRPLDNTALSAYMACPREYYYSMQLHRRSDSRGSPALTFGAGWHHMMEARYKGMSNPAVLGYADAMWEEPIGAEGDYRTLARLKLCYKQYCEKWGETPAQEQGRTIGFPDNPMVEIAVNGMGEDLIHPYAGKIDRIIDLGGMLYVEDHKTTSRLDSNFFRSFELSNQMMGYTYLAQQLMPSERIVGVRINLLHATKTITNFDRQLFSFTKQQIDEWVFNTNMWMKRLSQDAGDWHDMETWNQFNPANPRFPLGHYGTNGCDRKYGLCGYHNVCRVIPQLRTRVLEELPINPWNPLEIED